mmetsp:Transcript_5104/g.9971  ORF Transcript_5104/g.9971 Transcript_5104/m.9971 type:complete len:186 (-) Transcript_5104:1153-1710(-)
MALQRPHPTITLQLPRGLSGVEIIRSSSPSNNGSSSLSYIVASKSDETSPLEVGDVIESLDGTSLLDAEGGILSAVAANNLIASFSSSADNDNNHHHHHHHVRIAVIRRPPVETTVGITKEDASKTGTTAATATATATTTTTTTALLRRMQKQTLSFPTHFYSLRQHFRIMSCRQEDSKQRAASQ